MTPDQPIDPELDPPVPAALRSQLNKLMRSTTRIVVYSDEGAGKTRKLNALRITNTPGGYPKEPLEDIAREVVRIMHAAWSEQETEDPEIGFPPMEFVVSCEHHKDGKRVRPQFGFVYHGGPGDTDDGYEQSMSVEEAVMQRTIDSLERTNGQLMGHVDLLHHKFLTLVEKQSNALTSSGAAAAETMKQAIPMFFGGVQQMLNAKFLEFNAARAEAKEAATTERIVGGLKALAPFLGLAASQIVAKKLGIDPSALIGMFMGGGAQQHNDEDASSDPSQTSDEAAADEEVPTELLAAFAEELGRSLTNAQRREIARQFTKVQAAALDDLFCASTDEEAFIAFGAVKDKAGPQLVALQQMLVGEQRQILATFMQALHQYAATRPS